MSASIQNPMIAGMTGQYRGAAFDRSTKAGRLLHNIYNASGKESTLDRDLAKRLEQRRKQMEELQAAQAKPKPVPKSRAFVELPTAPPREMPKYLPPIGRRPLKQIEQNECLQNGGATGDSALRQQQRLQEEAFLAKRGAAITDQDKFKLQHKFQFGFEPTPLVMTAFLAKQGGADSKKQQPANFSGGGNSAMMAHNKSSETERKMWQRRFNELEVEIEDRKMFLREMDESNNNNNNAHGNDGADGVAAPAAAAAAAAVAGRGHKNLAGKERRHRIVVELQDKIREMKEIDEKLRKMDADEDDDGDGQH